MKKRSSSKTSKTNFRRLHAMTDRDIKRIARVIIRRGLKPVPPKASVSLRIDADVLEWFKMRGAGYQTRINSVLRAFKEAPPL